AAASLIGVMLTAIRKVHAVNGPWNTRGGYEYNLVLIAALLGLVDGGPGDLSVDRALGIHDTGPAWALAALGIGAAASAATGELGHGSVLDAQYEWDAEAVDQAGSPEEEAVRVGC